jgi:transcriptional regulator of arginine metabolism
MNPVSPATKAARQAQIASILEQVAVHSQDELADWLAHRGVRVTQTTLSRDLEELGAVRLRGPDGALVYALPGEPGGPGSRPGGLAESIDAGPAEAGDPAGPAGRRAGVTSTAVGSGGGTIADGAGRAGAADQPAGIGAEPRARLARAAAELLVSAEASANLVIVRTPAGAAQFLASVIDHASWPSILGTVAGDDTVLVIARDPAGGTELAHALLRLAERRN